MAIFVKQITTGNEYLFLGTALSSSSGLSLSNLPFFRGNITSETSPESPYWVVLCDQNGEIFWLPTTEVLVTEIEGKTPSELLEDKITSPLADSLANEPTITIHGEAKNDEDLDNEDDDWI